MTTAEKHRVFRPAVVLLFLAALIAAQRLHTYREPLEQDLTSYAIIADGLLHGRNLYTDLWDHKPPGVHLTYAAGLAAAGRGPLPIYCLGLCAAAATLLGCYAAGKALAGSRMAGLWAALFWALVCSDCALQANQPNVEVFMNACLVWAFALLARSCGGRGGVIALFSAAVLLFLSSFYKYVTLVAAGLLILAYAAFAHAPPGRRLRGTAAMAGTVGALWLAVVGYFFAAGRLADFWYAVVTFNRSYAGGLSENLLASLGPSNLPPAAALCVGVLASLAILALARIISDPGDRCRGALFLAYAAGAHLMAALPGQWYPHYFQLYLPPIAVGAAWLLDRLRRALPGRGGLVSAGLGAAAAAALLARELPLYRLPADDWSRLKYGGQFIEVRRTGREIGALLEKDETFYVWGCASGLYYYARRTPPSGILFNFPLLVYRGAPRLSARVLAELESAPPELFVVDRGEERRGPVIDWFEKEYRPLPAAPGRGRFDLYARRGGRLDAGRGAPVHTPAAP